MPKNVYGNLYVHVNYISTLPAESLRILRQALLLLPSNYIWTIAKVSADKGSVTFCHYPDFDENPHPELAEWMKIDLIHQMTKRGLGSTENPLILHRKETFVDERHHLYAKFHRLSIQEEKAGLYDLDLKSRIGRKRFWEKMLAEKGLRIVDHEIQALHNPAPAAPFQLELFSQSEVLSEGESVLPLSSKTAKHRSRPSSMACILVEQKLLKGRIFDWGCGHGKDLEYFRQCNFSAEGWDPIHMPDKPPMDYSSGSFDWVHCAYVLNTIPNPIERLAILHAIYEFLPCGGHLSLAVRSQIEIESLRKGTWKQLGDGWLTSRNTFQKGFEPEEVVTLLKKSFAEVTVIITDPVLVIARK